MSREEAMAFAEKKGLLFDECTARDHKSVERVCSHRLVHAVLSHWLTRGGVVAQAFLKPAIEVHKIYKNNPQIFSRDALRVQVSKTASTENSGGMLDCCG